MSIRPWCRSASQAPHHAPQRRMTRALSFPIGEPLLAASAGFALLLLGPPALAQSVTDGLNQRFWVQVGAYRPDIDSEVRVDQRAGAFNGTNLKLEQELGLPDRKTLASLLAGMRIDSRWRAEFEYFSLKRSGRQDPLGGPVMVGDTAFSAEIDGRFDTRVYRASAGYSFVRSPQVEIGGTLGLHVTDFHVSLAGTGTVNGQPVAVAVEEEQRTVPLPTVGIYAGLALTPSWVLSGRADVFKMKLRGNDGQLLNLQANLVYRMTPNIGLGVGYRYNDYRIEGSGSFKGRVDYRYGGPQAFVEVGF